MTIKFSNIDKAIIHKLSLFIRKRAPNVRKPKYSIEYYVKNIIYLFKTGCRWRYLNCKSDYYEFMEK